MALTFLNVILIVFVFQHIFVCYKIVLFFIRSFNVSHPSVLLLLIHNALLFWGLMEIHVVQRISFSSRIHFLLTVSNQRGNAC